MRLANLKQLAFFSCKKICSFFFDIQGLASLTRLPLCFFILSLVFCLLTSEVCSAETQGYRNEARSVADLLRKSSPPASQTEEYGSTLAAFDEADEFSLQNKSEQADKLYQLVLFKSFILNKKLHPLDISSIGIQIPASPSDDPSDMNWKKPSGAVHPAVTESKKDTLPVEVAPYSAGTQTLAKVPYLQPSSPVIHDSSPENVTTGNEDRIEDDEAELNPVSSSLMIGKEFIYTVRKHDSLRKIGAKLGVGWRTIAKENDLDPKKPLESGQELVINTRRIIPKTLNKGILINIPDRTLYLFKDKKLEMAVPVALGMPTYQDYGDWRTPTGHFRILSKMKNPTWHVPPSIQTEMKQNKKKVVTEFPPGDGNPLGKYALKTSLSGILIHSTIHPASIYNFASHGCIRVNPKNMEEIFPEIPVHANGEIVYKPVKLAFSDDGRVFIEVHGDIYKRFKKLDQVAKDLIIRNKAEQRVDWDKVRILLRKKSGIPEDVTLDESDSEN
jgi:lipoprotein-anchoring transpeptidase ErfK/SrfK